MPSTPEIVMGMGYHNKHISRPSFQPGHQVINTPLERGTANIGLCELDSTGAI